MPHAVWKGRIQFGPVDIPVKLYSAVADISVHSHLLHDQDNVRLQQKMVCEAENTPVPKEQYAKGYEVETGQYVILEPDELDFLQPQASRQIQITEFVETDQLDERYLDRTYYLGPDNDDQLYANLTQSLKKSNLAGICQWTMRKKSYIGVLQFQNDILTLTTHRYAAEVVSTDSFNLDQANISDKELQISTTLINQLQQKFQPEKYHDEYQIKLQKLIEQKAKGQKVELPAIEKVAQTDENQLLDALEKSLKSLKASND